MPMANAECRTGSGRLRHPAFAIRALTVASWLTAGLLVLTVVYAVLQVGFVRPHLPADPDAEPRAAAGRSTAGDGAALAAWRDGVSRGPGRRPVWQDRHAAAGRGRTSGMIVQVIVFTVAAIVLLVLRSSDLTAQLCVLALALSGVAGGGPLLGAEQVLPFGTRPRPDGLRLARRSAGVSDHRARDPALPVPLAAPHAPPLALRRAVRRGGADARAGDRDVAVSGRRRVDARRGAVGRRASGRVLRFVRARARHQRRSRSSKGVYRYQFNHDANERRRIRMAVYTAVPGVIGYAIKDGVPIVAMLAGAAHPVVSVAGHRVPAVPGAAAGVRADLCRRRGARPRARRWSCGAASSTRSPTARSRCSRSCPARRSSTRCCTKNLRADHHERLGRLPAAVRRDARGRALPRPRAAVARSAVLPRGVRRAEDPAVARQPRALRDRSRRPGVARRRADRPGAAPGSHRHARQRHRGRPARRRSRRAVRDVGAAGARRRPGDDAALVGRAAGDLPGRPAIAGAAPAAGGDRVAGANGRVAASSRCSARIARSSARSCSARSDPKKRIRPKTASCSAASRRRSGSGSTSRACAAAAADSVTADRRRLTRDTPQPPMMECPRCGRCEDPGDVGLPGGRRDAEGRPDAARHRQQVPHRAAARARRHGRGLSRARHAARSTGRGEGRARRAARGQRRAAPVPARGAARRAAAAPGHRVDLRLRHARPAAARTW